MKALILAAGYGTRLYPLTEKQAKPLIDVGGKPMIEHIIGRLGEINTLDEIYIVHNEKFSGNFSDWAKNYECAAAIRLLNDGSTDDTNKLGAVGDMRFAVEEARISDDLIVIAGDNLFDFSLAGILNFFETKGTAIGLYEVSDMELVKKYSVVELDSDKRVVSFEEKPRNPATNLAAICLYLFPGEKLGRIREYMEKGNNPDAPGYYIKWLSENDRVYGAVLKGRWLDIGDFKSLDEARKIFAP